jgi:hypothetical protein
MPGVYGKYELKTAKNRTLNKYQEINFRKEPYGMLA